MPRALPFTKGLRGAGSAAFPLLPLPGAAGMGMRPHGCAVGPLPGGTAGSRPSLHKGGAVQEGSVPREVSQVKVSERLSPV